MSQVRVGIDVGGTFTHAVAIDNESLQILGFAVTPTTHRASEGVARGVVDVFLSLLETLKKESIQEEQIIFVAHSTTQATNALLEGDVASVGIVALGSGVEGMKVKMDAEIPDIEVAPGKMLHTFFTYLDTGKAWEDVLQKTLADLEAKGAGSIVAAEAFSVDDPSRELKVKEAAESRSIPACGTFEMSGLYGLRVRTRTAVINASILPRMLETATMTEESLKKAHVHAPLMIMRSDGGVMSIEEMKHRPLLTLLSGPAAGIAAALTYIRATDAIFLEVGGTSTDISVVRNGKSIIRSAHIGGHQTYMKTLDSRTLGVAGGSLVQLKDNAIVEVGPRSAHIAGLPYAAFTDIADLSGTLEVTTVKPLSDDPPYLAVRNDRGDLFAVTTTCAANYLGYIKEGDYAWGKSQSLAKVFQALSLHMKKDEAAIAEDILSKASQKIIPTLQALIRDYELAEKSIRLIGGGGGSYAIVPYLARQMNTDYEIASHAEVISAIGAALAMVRETIERNIFNAKPEDIEEVRKEAERSCIKMGASPETVEVYIEVDGQKNIVRAVATGAIEFKSQDLLTADIGDEGKKKVLSGIFGVEPAEIQLMDSTEFLSIYEVTKTEKKLFNLIKSVKKTVAVIEGKGTVKLQVPGGLVKTMAKEDASLSIKKILDENRVYGDAGSSAPSIFVVFGRRVLDLSSVVEEEQILSLAVTELEKVPKGEKIAVIIRKSA
ncbi:MAG: hydantoinase/oxoprolinase family protein [Vulcanimicrobiota bacterium]